MTNFRPELPNQAVHSTLNPGIRGITTGKYREDGTDLFVQIQIGANEKKWLPLDDLQLTTSTGEDLDDLLRSLKFGKKSDFARILTFHKIRSNLSNLFYSMQASRTEFYAHQFKPVYKFNESVRGRLLIADEVGLGKTIEAGLIWLEIMARRADAHRLLVVCPPMLRDKWKKELRSRFDVSNAQIFDSKQFRELIGDFHREGENFRCAAICSLQTVRQDGVQLALEGLENENLKFDLTVIDESHHLRNVSTKSHKAGKVLSDVSDAMVLLSATPIHLRDEDLFRQLNILEPDEFSDYALVQQRLADNEPLIVAQTLLRKHPPDIDGALIQIRELKNKSWFRGSELLALVENQLESLSGDDRQGLIELGRRIEKMNLFGATIARTRKREVQEKRVERQALALKVTFSAEEMAFYDAVTEAVQAKVETENNPMAGFALMMPQRMMASSIPAMVMHYRGKAEWDAEVFDELVFFSEPNSTPAKAPAWNGLESVVAKWDLTNIDTKFKILLEALRNCQINEPDVKIIVFSFFKKTLAYLNQRLAAEGFNVSMIHGAVEMEDRVQIIEAFRSDPNRQVLLSSEVGSEGIDLEFCRIIVNYDLPWNPMKVEQRIGRLDRLGQRADKITILNFSVADTIEEKILERLYNRIGIFQRSLGDLEQILGDTTEKLHLDLLSHRLTKQEEDRRIEETLRALETRFQLEEELVEQSAVFLGSSEFILQQITSARDGGRWITPAEIKGFIQDFFEHNYRGTIVKWNEPSEGLLTIGLTNDARNQFRMFCDAQQPQLRTSLMYESKVILVHDAQLSQSKQNVELLSHFHPLIKWIAGSHESNEQAFFPTSAVDLRTLVVPPGVYMLTVQFWEFEAIQRQIRIEYSMAAIEPEIRIGNENAEALIREALTHGNTWEFANRVLAQEKVIEALELCLGDLRDRYATAFEEFRRESEELKSRRRQHIEAFSVRKQEQASKAIETLREKLHTADYKDRPKVEAQIKGNQTKITNLQDKLTFELRKIENQSQYQKNFTEIAVAICRVRK